MTRENAKLYDALLRYFHFLRYTPPRQIARRLYLRLKRHVLDRLPFGGSPPLYDGPGLARLPCLPLEGPHGTLIQKNGVWEATFLNKTRTLGGKVDWYTEALDKRSQLWCMNLHYFEYLPEMDVPQCIYLIADWVKNYRPQDVRTARCGWTPYAVSLRLSAWLASWSARGPYGDKEFQKLFAQSVYEQANYLAANLETDIRGNHLIKNIRALTEAAFALNCAAATNWKKLAGYWLAAELDTQILSDGVHFEKSPSYHAQVFADLMAIYTVREKDDLSVSLAKKLDHMAVALYYITHPDGKIAQFGDAGLDMAVSTEKCLQAYTQLRQKPVLIADGCFSMADAGFYGMHHGDTYIIFKMGSLGPDALMAHAHEDWGSFEWSVAEQRIFVDQGVYEYVEGNKRKQSQSQSSHNTVALEGTTQADFFSSFRCGKRPHPVAATFKELENGFLLDGTMIPAVGKAVAPVHRRVHYTPEELCITDETNGDGLLTSRLLLHPSVRPCLADENGKVRFTTETGITIECFTNDGTTLGIQEAEWWPNMGYALQTHRIVAEGKEIIMTLRVIS
jgi:uncharacterized heparinase superfamily protein